MTTSVIIVINRCSFVPTNLALAVRGTNSAHEAPKLYDMVAAVVALVTTVVALVTAVVAMVTTCIALVRRVAILASSALHLVE